MAAQLARDSHALWSWYAILYDQEHGVPVTDLYPLHDSFYAA